MDTPWERISSQRCWQLLAAGSLGRVALSVRALPVIRPAQYRLSGHRLVVCLGHGEIPDRSLHDAIVAFSADAIDPATWSGWSVQIQGRSSLARHGDFGFSCDQPAGARMVEIEPASITGFQLRLCSLIGMVTGDPRPPA